MLLLIDNYDSFTYNLLDYFYQLGQDCQLIRNNIDVADLPLNPVGVVISPGPMDPLHAGNLMNIIAHYVEEVPMLGICLGHQALALHFGAKIKHALKPIHGKISLIENSGKKIFKGLPTSYKVVRYHSLIVENLPDCLEPLAKTSEEENMAFCHKELAVCGIQFHPEAALTENGLEILSNWLRCYLLK